MFKESFLFGVAANVGEVDATDINDTVPFNDVLYLLHHDEGHLLELLEGSFDHVLTAIEETVG
jgi:hypothetical protein